MSPCSRVSPNSAHRAEQGHEGLPVHVRDVALERAHLERALCDEAFRAELAAAPDPGFTYELAADRHQPARQPSRRSGSVELRKSRYLRLSAEVSALRVPRSFSRASWFCA